MALRRRGLAARVVGVGRSSRSLTAAYECGAVTETTTNLADGVKSADVIVVCTPVSCIPEFVNEASLACRPAALITDAGSTKESVCSALAAGLSGNGRFVGSHPMAGSEKSGVLYADPDLFSERVTVVTPVAATDEQAVADVTEFWESLGSRVVRMTPRQHDDGVAAVSHLPHLVASVLAAATDTKDFDLAATGWLDTTRVAAGNPELWKQIFLENRDHVLQALDNFASVLSTFRHALESADGEQIERILNAGKRVRDALER